MFPLRRLSDLPDKRCPEGSAACLVTSDGTYNMGSPSQQLELVSSDRYLLHVCYLLVQKKASSSISGLEFSSKLEAAECADVFIIVFLSPCLASLNKG